MEDILALINPDNDTGKEVVQHQEEQFPINQSNSFPADITVYPSSPLIRNFPASQIGQLPADIQHMLPDTLHPNQHFGNLLKTAVYDLSTSSNTGSCPKASTDLGNPLLYQDEEALEFSNSFSTGLVEDSAEILSEVTIPQFLFNDSATLSLRI